MKKMSIVIAVPLIVVAAVIAIVFAVKLNSQTTNADTKAYEKRVYPGLNAGGNKPGSGYAGIPTPTVTGSTVSNASASQDTSDLSTQLQSTQDDEGAADLNTIKQDENSL
jgi:hypothetical protein